MMQYYPFIWLIILSITLLIYLINDGSALGMSLSIPWLPHRLQQKALNLLLPTWDANQTWLVFTLAGLYGGFPLGFSVVMNLLYLPLILLLLALICRGAAIEYAIKSHKKYWLLTLSLSSLIIIVLQAYALTTMVSSIVKSIISNYNGWNTVYFLLGTSIFLLFDLQLGLNQLADRSTIKAQRLLLIILMICFTSFIFMYTPLSVTKFFNHWQLLVLILTELMFVILMLTQRHNPIFFRIILIFFALLNMTIVEYCIFPYYFPNCLSYQNAAAETSSLKFMIGLAMLMLPLIFFTLFYFKHYFRTNMHDIYY